MLLPESILVNLPVWTSVERERIGHERLGLLPHLVGLFGDELVFGRMVGFGPIRSVGVDSVWKRNLAGTRGPHNRVSTLLYVLAGLENDSRPHGLLVKDELDQHYAGEINHGRLYPNLDELVEMGLVEKGTIDDRTNSYALSERGRREIETRREWEDQYIAIEG